MRSRNAVGREFQCVSKLVRKAVESSLSFSGRDSPAGRIEIMAVKPSRIIGERGITLVTDALQYNGDVPRDVLIRFPASIDERGEGGVEPRIARGKTEGHRDRKSTRLNSSH